MSPCFNKLKIPVLGKIVTVIEVDDMESDGLFVHKDWVLKINKDLSDDDLSYKIHVLAHELVHALLARIGLTGYLSETTEEMLAEAFSNWLLEIFNPDISQVLRFKGH
tara:strand:- start:4378 stop:4701 length:324 start_codon:yes stop_codon:yes gene_type:complete